MILNRLNLKIIILDIAIIILIIKYLISSNWIYNNKNNNNNILKAQQFTVNSL